MDRMSDIIIMSYTQYYNLIKQNCGALLSGGKIHI